MKSLFKFKKFLVEQSPLVFKIGTDGVLLGCLADSIHAQTILDIGTGTGVLSLISSQRNPKAKIIAIDSEREAYLLAKENVVNSPFYSQIDVIHTDLNHFNPTSTFDYIICNPPYFKSSEQLHLKHPIARHQIKLDYSLLIEKSKKLLSPDGLIGYIFPFEDEKKVISLAQSLNLFPKKIIYISGILNGKVKRVFLELSPSKQKVKTETLYIEQTPRVWSEEYRKLTQDFYL